MGASEMPASDVQMADLTHRFVANLPMELAAALRAAAIPHWFDADVLATILQVTQNQADRLVSILCGMPLVQPWPESKYAIHELARHPILSKYWQEQPDLYQEQSRRAAEYFTQLANTSDDARLRIEAIYHWLLAEPERGRQEVREWGEGWYNTFQYSLVFALVQTALEHDQASRLSERARGWVYLLNGRYHIVHDQLFQANESLEHAIRTANDDSVLRADCTQAQGDVHLMMGRYGIARVCYEEALLIYREMGAKLGEANCIHALGNVHRLTSEYRMARARYEEALVIYRTIGARMGEATCIQALGDVYRLTTEYGLAKARYEEAFSIYQEIGARMGQASCVKALGDVYRMLAEYEPAQMYYEEALSTYREIRAKLGIANCIKALGDVHRMLAKYEPAQANYKEALSIYQEIGVRPDEANCIKALGDVHRMVDEYEAAQAHYSAALLIYQETGARLDEANCIKALGDVHRLMSEYEMAQTRYEAVLPIYREIGAKLGEANCIQAIADVHMSLGEHQSAQVHYEEVLPIYQETGARLEAANCIQALGDVHLLAAEYGLARARYEEAFSIYQEIGARLGQANCIKALGDVHRLVAIYEPAQMYYEEALSIYREIGAKLGAANCIKALGDVYMDMLEYERAQTHYQKALLIYQVIRARLGEANCMTALGDVWFEMANEGPALDAYQSAFALYLQLGLNKAAAGTLNNQAKIYERRKDYIASLLLYTQATTLMPTNAMWYRNRANTYIHLQNPRAASVDLAEAARLQPTHPYLHLRYGDLALHQREFARAVEHYQAFIDAQPRNHVGYFGLARAYFGQHQTETALNALDRSLKLTRSPQEVREALAELQDIYTIDSLYPGVSEGIKRLQAWLATQGNITS